MGSFPLAQKSRQRAAVGRFESRIELRLRRELLSVADGVRIGGESLVVEGEHLRGDDVRAARDEGGAGQGAEAVPGGRGIVRKVRYVGFVAGHDTYFDATVD